MDLQPSIAPLLTPMHDKKKKIQYKQLTSRIYHKYNNK